MAKLEYDETGRLLFTQEMRKEYTIPIPQMLTIHFDLFAKPLDRTASKVAFLNHDRRTVEESDGRTAGAERLGEGGGDMGV